MPDFALGSPFVASAAIAAVTALLVALGIALTTRWHLAMSGDTDVGVQKVHVQPTPRIGGVATISALLVALAAFAGPGSGGSVASLLVVLALSAAPVAVAGVVEDVTGAVPPSRRLAAAMVSGAVFAVIFSGGHALVDVQWIAPPQAWSVLAGIALVTVGVAGIANAVNIIDGFHGLAAGYVIATATAIAAIAGRQGDPVLALAALAVSGAHFGFLLVNFPFGRLFLGDGGAYAAGAVLAMLCVMLTVRNPDVSPFVCVLLVLYPALETAVSILRKLRRAGHAPHMPDGVHFHMLLGKRVARPLARRLGRPGWYNPLTGALIWPLVGATSVLAVAANGSGQFAGGAMAVFTLIYLRLYAVMGLRTPSVVSLMRRLRQGSEGKARRSDT